MYQNTILKILQKILFIFLEKEDFLPYLEDAAAADYEQAKALRIIYKSLRQKK